MEALTPYRMQDRLPPFPIMPAKARPRRRLGPVGVFFLRTKKARRLAGLGSRWLDRLMRPGFTPEERSLAYFSKVITYRSGGPPPTSHKM